jgi:deoxyribose-phosphate aldolase
MCRLVSASGADYIKTSTGFAAGGATFEDIELMRRLCDTRVKIKAAGGIASLADAERFLALGADRLGTSRIVKIAMERERLEAEAAAVSETEAPAVPELPAD